MASSSDAIIDVDDYEQWYKALDIFVFVGVIFKMITLTVLLVEAVNKWRGHSHEHRWLIIGMLLAAWLFVSFETLNRHRSSSLRCSSSHVSG